MKATHFHLLYQERDGALWRTLVQPNGNPLTLPLDVTHAAFLTVASRAGSYMLVPVDATGVQRGEPPQRLHVRGGDGAAGDAASDPKAPTDQKIV